jgi:hypothetical protein
MQAKILADDRILKIINRIKNVFIVYFLGTVVVCLHALSRYPEGFLPGESGNERILRSLIAMILLAALCEGIKYRKKWFIPLVLVSSAFYLLNFSLKIFQPAAYTGGTYSLNVLYLKFFLTIIAMFNLYLIYFFTRREVKAHFGMQGTILF